MASGRLVAAVVTAALVAAACGEAATAPPTPSDPGPSHSEPRSEPVVDRPPTESPDVEDLVAGLNEVGYGLFHVAAEQSAGDVVLSPLSIGIAFGMADAGASGQTADVLADLFAYPVDGEARWSAFHSLEQSVTRVGGPVVRLANREFPDTGFATVDGYDEVLARWFGAGIEPLPLQNDPEPSRGRINGWVSERTEGLIPELLPPGFVNELSVMVLVNALYLEADWSRPFGKYPTKDARFTRLDGSTVTVPLMHELELSGPAIAAGDYAATEIPYEGGELSMLVIVPVEGRYEQIQARLGGDLVAEIDATAKKAVVELWLPRFDSDATLDLREAIEGGLGVDGLFGVPGWDGIAPDITLEQAVHAADISVDENGTVAAAATGLGFETSGPPEPEITVRADRPFLYLIRHRSTGAVLFVGRVLDPKA
jgi:serpin B